MGKHKDDWQTIKRQIRSLTRNLNEQLEKLNEMDDFIKKLIDNPDVHQGDLNGLIESTNGAKRLIQNALQGLTGIDIDISDYNGFVLDQDVTFFLTTNTEVMMLNTEFMNSLASIYTTISNYFNRLTHGSLAT